MLAEKVIKGGQGVWGAVPMTPHPALTQADAEQMVKYVMLLKNK
jgi:cytochrome c